MSFQTGVRDFYFVIPNRCRIFKFCHSESPQSGDEEPAVACHPERGALCRVEGPAFSHRHADAALCSPVGAADNSPEPALSEVEGDGSNTGSLVPLLSLMWSLIFIDFTYIKNALRKGHATML
jgi:hypothetical protein